MIAEGCRLAGRDFGQIAQQAILLRTFAHDRSRAVAPVSHSLNLDIAWGSFLSLGAAAPDPPMGSEHPVAVSLVLTPSEVGLAWLPRHTRSALFVAGTANVEHLEENLAFVSLKRLALERDPFHQDAEASERAHLRGWE